MYSGNYNFMYINNIKDVNNKKELNVQYNCVLYVQVNVSEQS